MDTNDKISIFLIRGEWKTKIFVTKYGFNATLKSPTLIDPCFVI